MLGVLHMREPTETRVVEGNDRPKTATPGEKPWARGRSNGRRDGHGRLADGGTKPAARKAPGKTKSSSKHPEGLMLIDTNSGPLRRAELGDDEGRGGFDTMRVK